MCCKSENFIYFCNMENKVIRGAAKLYYEENVEGEPLDQDTPIECFEAGAQFIINSQKKRNNCNIPKENSYKIKSKKMKDKYRKIVENTEKIIHVTGFYVTAVGDPSVGINSATWEIINDFYFDNPEEFEDFCKEIKNLFEFHCEEVVEVITFEEYQAIFDAEEKETYKRYPVRYLIKDSNNYKEASSTASYSSNIGDGIHFELPHWIDENRTEGEDRVIKSTTDEYWKILITEAGRLEHEIDNNEYSLKNAKRNLKLILNELKHRSL